MDTFSAIETRRSIKMFDPDHVMTEAEIERLMGAAVLSPTAFNLQNWRFVLVTDAELKGRIREAGWGQAQFSDCSLLVILCGDLQAHAREPERYWRHAPESARGAIVPMITGHYADRPDRRHDEALRSCGMAAQTIMLAAEAMGYNTCPMSGFDFEKVGELIGLPDDHEIVMAVTVGKGVKEPAARGGQLPLDDVVVRDRFTG